MTDVFEIDVRGLARLIAEEVTSASGEGDGERAALAGLIDHTLLAPEATRDDIARICDEAVAHGFATVCVNPVWVAEAAGRLSGTPVGIAAVVGFPLGATTASIKAAETREALAAGASEIDMVLPIGLLRSGDVMAVAAAVQAVAEPCRAAAARCKAIIEAALLTDREKVTACVIAVAAGATDVKTSTGFGPGGATTADVALMRRVVGPDVGVKAAGGIRDLSALRAMVAAGATRIGTSAGVAIMAEAGARVRG